MAKREYGTRKKYHFIYKTTNLLSGRYYIGMHSTDDLSDGYLGSGTLLRRSIKKHGKENFKIEILEFLDSREALVAREKEIISLQEIAKKECMNLKVGGEGGFSSEEHKQKFLQGREWGKLLGAKTGGDLRRGVGLESTHKALISLKMKEHYTTNIGHFSNRTHSEQTKKKMSNAKKGKGLAQTNSQYGTCWITDEYSNKKILKGETIPEGWRLGRKIKK